MTRKQVFILVALVLFVAVAVVFGISSRRNKTANNGLVSKDELNRNQQVQQIYSPEVPKGAKPTEPNKILETPAVPDSRGISLKIFEITASKNKYEPNEIVINKNDMVEIRLTSVGGDYDFTVPALGLYQFVKNGETKKIKFGVNTEGVFVFECRDYCPNQKIKGTLTVIP